ncbi:hypothetical protein KM043_018504 [Ampulex compressa]|nr:hypothetical protein KM043_018504 [Ampulex compressa]
MRRLVRYELSRLRITAFFVGTAPKKRCRRKKGTARSNRDERGEVEAEDFTSGREHSVNPLRSMFSEARISMNEGKPQPESPRCVQVIAAQEASLELRD